MGQAKIKLLEASKLVDLDLNAPEYVIAEPDKRAFQAELSEDEGLNAKASRVLFINLCGAKFPQGMGRVDGKIWAAWIETLDEPKETVTVSKGQLDWLVKIAQDDELKLPIGLAQWREAFLDYAEVVKVSEAEKVSE